MVERIVISDNHKNPEERRRNEIFLMERMIEVFTNFDWALFKKIVENYKVRSGDFFSTIKHQALKDQRHNIRMYGLPLSTAITRSPIEIGKPDFIFDNNIGSIATASFLGGRYGNIRFNLIRMISEIQRVFNNFERKNIKVDFDIVYLYVMKVLIHELMHLEGRVGNELVGEEWNPVDEVVVEILSFEIMKEIFSATGTTLTEEQIMLYFDGVFDIYDPEKKFFMKFTKYLAQIEKQTQKGIIDSFFWAFFSRFKVSRPEFIETLPEKIREIWMKFLKLKKFDDASIVDGLTNELDKLQI